MASALAFQSKVEAARRSGFFALRHVLPEPEAHACLLEPARSGVGGDRHAALLALGRAVSARDAVQRVLPDDYLRGRLFFGSGG